MSEANPNIPPGFHEKELGPNPYARPKDAERAPPTGFLGTLRFLGPSFILIGSIVGSGELILTTSFGAAAGFAALWFILVSSVCKTIVQAELARYTISSGDTCLEALNRIPGPRFRVGWLIWFFVIWQIPGLITGGAILGATGQVLSVAFGGDQTAWALLIAFVNIGLLLVGRYQMLERVSLFLVLSFSFITVAGAIALQFTASAVPLETALDGLIVRLQPLMAPAVLAVAVSAFAGTGVSGGELIAYTYWCVEKGYARYTGEATDDPDWLHRARGWVRVMQVDVWMATIVFTATTLAFFWLGAGVLFPRGLQPTNDQMISTIQQIYTGSLGPWAATLFLIGAFFVLYSTVFSGTAGSARMYADLMGIFGTVDFRDYRRRVLWIRIFTVLVPLVQAAIFFTKSEPKSMLVYGAIANGMLIPVLACCAVWLRYRGTDPRLRPTHWTDVILWPCTLLIVTVSSVYLALQLPKLLGQ